jgi:hypothetical protein
MVVLYEKFNWSQSFFYNSWSSSKFNDSTMNSLIKEFSSQTVSSYLYIVSWKMFYWLQSELIVSSIAQESLRLSYSKTAIYNV